MPSPSNRNQREQVPGEGAGASQLPGESGEADGNVTPRIGGRWGEMEAGGELRGVVHQPGVAVWGGCILQRVELLGKGGLACPGF